MNQVTPTGAIVRHNATTLRFATGDLAQAQYVDAKHLDAALARIAELEKAPVEHQSEPAKLHFPTMLRKMWSGGEVQQWLEEQGPLYRHPLVTQGDSATLQKVYDVFGTGELARTPSTLLTCLGNLRRFSDYLSAVEREFFMVPGEPSDEPEDEGCEPDDECLMNRWGAHSTEHYVEQFRAALDHLYGLKLVMDRIQVRLGKEQIKAVLLANGFKVKPQEGGPDDLHPYVYEAAGALLALYEEAYNACPPNKGEQ